MIKATIKSFKGAEFKVNQNVFVWVGFACADAKEIVISTTCHATKQEAKDNKLTKTDKELALMLHLPPQFSVKTSDLTAFTNIDTLLVAIQERINLLIKNESHIATLEIV
jgi:hypothetical protein